MVAAQGGQPGLTNRLGQIRPSCCARRVSGGDAQRGLVAAFDQLVDAQLVVEGLVPEPPTAQVAAEIGRAQRQLRVGALRGGERVGTRPGKGALRRADIRVTGRHPCEQCVCRQIGGAVVGKGRTGQCRAEWSPEQDGNQGKKR